MDAELEVLRCVDCQRLVTNKEIKHYGKCPKCGCKRMKTVLIMSEKEKDDLRARGVSEDFFALFEETPPPEAA